MPMGRPLPTVPIPLLPPDAAAQVSLQDVFADVYDRARYCNRIDYAAAPVSALTEAQEELADRLLRASGKR